MEIFIYLVIIFVVIKVVQEVIKKGKQAEIHPPAVKEEPFSLTLEDVRRAKAPVSVVSPYGFYRINIDDQRKELTIIVENQIICRVPFRRLRDCEVITRNNAVIILEVSTSIENHTLISVECFNKLKSIPRLSEELRRPIPLSQIYQSELNKAEAIEDLVFDIIEEMEEMEEDAPPPYEPEKPKESEKIIHSIPVVKVEKVEAEPYKEEIKEIILPEEQAYIPDDILPEKEPIEAEIEDAPVTEEVIVLEEPIEDKVRISLSDIEYYSYGKFLESEVQSAVGDAKMRGKKEIFITTGQLERLKQ